MQGRTDSTQFSCYVLMNYAICIRCRGEVSAKIVMKFCYSIRIVMSFIQIQQVLVVLPRLVAKYRENSL